MLVVVIKGLGRNVRVREAPSSPKEIVVEWIIGRVRVDQGILPPCLEGCEGGRQGSVSSQSEQHGEATWRSNMGGFVLKERGTCAPLEGQSTWR